MARRNRLRTLFRRKILTKSQNEHKKVPQKNTVQQQKAIHSRKEHITRRKNFTVSFLLLILLWVSIPLLIIFVDPSTPWSVPVFIGIVFVALTFTFSFLLINSRRGILIGSVCTIFLILRFYGLGSLINFALVAALAGVIEYYLYSSS